MKNVVMEVKANVEILDKVSKKSGEQYTVIEIIFGKGSENPFKKVVFLTGAEQYVVRAIRNSLQK